MNRKDEYQRLRGEIEKHLHNISVLLTGAFILVLVFTVLVFIDRSSLKNNSIPENLGGTKPLEFGR